MSAWRFVENSMFSWRHKREYHERLAQEDAAVLIARYGVKASHIANRRMAMMISDSNRSPCHWKRVHSTLQLLPYDEDSEVDG
jgi:hypothetical protein